MEWGSGRYEKEIRDTKYAESIDYIVYQNFRIMFHLFSLISLTKIVYVSVHKFKLTHK